MKEYLREAGWQQVLTPIFETIYFKEICKSVNQDIVNGITIYPPMEMVFNAFNLTPLEDIKVVILGQDPYHGEGQAHGLCFSVQDGVKPPPSLVNIFKELKSDLDIDIPNHGNLTSWAQQGVFLLNTYLTVQANTPLSHSKIGWEDFTNEVIKIISDHCDHVVFILWGANAQKKKTMINHSKHLIVESAHPSPLGAYRGFWGSRPFSKANEWLMDNVLTKVVWEV